MAKGQKRSGREPKKPKADKKLKSVAAPMTVSAAVETPKKKPAPAK
jgi:hypothetical protein